MAVEDRIVQDPQLEARITAIVAGVTPPEAGPEDEDPSP
jgi:hypothetical protein